MKNEIMLLRDRHLPIDQFRHAANRLAVLLAKKCVVKGDVVLVPVLRSGIVLLPAFLQVYPKALVGFIGAVRDEKTAEAHLYYAKLPCLAQGQSVLILDPMLATGGSAVLTMEQLILAGVQESQVILVSYIAAPEGIAHVQKRYPGVHILVAQVDEGLDERKFIVPGLGDFGDRYFGVEFTK